ncbi:MAG: type II toxin-antitoxin system VapB family antitoxin [Anaerolineae bacterium]|nr:type II toxin-antitoxin system VapB family antitoxin [Anaerolineae bacterium]
MTHHRQVFNWSRRRLALRTKRAVIEDALRTLVRLKTQEEVRPLRGKLRWEGNLDETRQERVASVNC